MGGKSETGTGKINNKETKIQRKGKQMKYMKQIVIPEDVERMATLAVDAAFAVHKELGPGLLG